MGKGTKAPKASSKRKAEENENTNENATKSKDAKRQKPVTPKSVATKINKQKTNFSESKGNQAMNKRRKLQPKKLNMGTSRVTARRNVQSVSLKETTPMCIEVNFKLN